MRYTLFLLAAMLGASSLHAQRVGNGDEQGMTAVSADNFLVQDQKAIDEAFTGWWKDSRINIADRMKWFEDVRFGCFVHWGVYSVPAGEWKGKRYGGYSEHLMRVSRIPVCQYRNELVNAFNPEEFDADKWMDRVQQAGMKYFIITAKHHDGFALFPSDAYPYDIRLTQFKRDPMKELREAARKRGIKFGFYYSHAFDWEHPDAPGNDWDFPDHPGGDRLIGGRDWWKNRPDFLAHAEKYVREKAIPQIRELIDNYHPDILWFDTPHKLPLYLNIEILKSIRDADPEQKIVVNGRLARFKDVNQGEVNLGDYANTGDRAAFFHKLNSDWEAIPTTNESYGYSRVDKSYKPASHFIRVLASAVSKGGNILLNVGPMGNGEWSQPDLHIFDGIGQWMQRYGDAVRGTVPTDLPIQNWGVTTQRNDTVFLHVFQPQKDGYITVGGLRSDISKVMFYGSKKPLPVKRIGDDFRIKLPKQMPDSISSVICLVINKRRPSSQERLLVANEDNILYCFDAELHGGHWGYGDGKPGRNYLTGWSSSQQKAVWKVRLSEPATYRVTFDYKNLDAGGSGDMNIRVGEQTFTVHYDVDGIKSEQLQTVVLGEIDLKPGIYEIMMDGTSASGQRLPAPIGITLHAI